MNGFEMHGITHLSASSINSFAAEPAMWIMERMLKRWGQTGSVALRGNAVEDGVTHGLLHPDASLEECHTIGQARFDKDTAFSSDPKRDAHRATIPAIINNALKELRQYGVPDRIQTRLEVTIPDVPVPFWGNLDYGWTSHGIVLDLKTSDKLSSKIVNSHARQGCLYVHNTNNQMRFAYVTHAKIGVYVLEDPVQHVEAVRQIAHRMERFLRISKDPMELAGLLAPDFDDFRWNDPKQRAVGREVFGF